MEIGITLDLREPEITQLYKESCSLMQLRELNRIFLETEGNLPAFLNLYKKAEAAGYRGISCNTHFSHVDGETRTIIMTKTTVIV